MFLLFSRSLLSDADGICDRITLPISLSAASSEICSLGTVSSTERVRGTSMEMGFGGSHPTLVITIKNALVLGNVVFNVETQ